jgi:hypothetical protein
MLEKREPEKCFYCNNVAEYNDIVDDNGAWAVSGVCSVHAAKYIEPA